MSNIISNECSFSNISMLMNRSLNYTLNNNNINSAPNVKLEITQETGGKSAKWSSIQMIYFGGAYTSMNASENSLKSLPSILVLPIQGIITEETHSSSSVVEFLDLFKEGDTIVVNIHFLKTENAEETTNKQIKINNRAQIIGVQYTDSYIVLCIESMSVDTAARTSGVSGVVRSCNTYKASHTNNYDCSRALYNDEFYDSIIQQAYKILTKLEFNSSTHQNLTIQIKSVTGNCGESSSLTAFQWEASLGYGAQGIPESLWIKYLFVIFSKSDNNVITIQELFKTGSKAEIIIKKEYASGSFGYQALETLTFSDAKVKMCYEINGYCVTVFDIQSVEVVQKALSKNKQVEGVKTAILKNK